MKSAKGTRIVATALLGACLLAFALVGCSRPNKVPAGPLDFTFVNNSGMIIKSIYVSPNNVDDWQENILIGDLVRAQGRMVIRFDHQEKTSIWDLKIEDTNGRTAEFKSLDLRRISRLTLRFRNGVAIAEAE